MVLQNVLPFWDTIKDNIESISKNNQVTICDFPILMKQEKRSSISISQMENTKNLRMSMKHLVIKK